MSEQVYIADGLRTRVESYPEPLNIITFIQKYHVTLHDGMRTPLNIEILTKDSTSVFKIKQLATLPPEELPIIQPGSAMLVGERTTEERNGAKAWIGQNKSSSDAGASIESDKKAADHHAVIASNPTISHPQEHTQSQNDFYFTYKVISIILISFVLFFSILYLKRRRFPN